MTGMASMMRDRTYKEPAEEPEIFEVTARHIEGTNMCMLTLPCKYSDKKVRFAVEVIE